MHFFRTRTNSRRSKLQWISVSGLLFVAVGSAFAQSGNRASELFSPPVVGSTPAIGDAPLPITSEMVPNKLFSEVTAPAVDLPAASAESISTPGIVNESMSAADTASTPPTTSAPSATSPISNWETNNSYQHAQSLWGNDGSAPPTVSYPSAGTASSEWSYGEPVDGPVQFAFSGAAPASCGSGGCGGNCGGRCGGGCGCLDGNCSSLCGCGPRTWGRFDVFLGFLNGYSTPALITRAPGNTVENSAGALGGDGTQVLFGNRDLGNNLRVGGRLQYGAWLDPCRRFGIQADFFGLGGGEQSTTFNGNGNDLFARPFFNTNPSVNGPDAQVFAMPGLAEGSVRFDRSSEVFSAAPSLRFNFCCCDGDPCNPRSSRVDLLLGYRFFRLEEQFASQENLRVTDQRFVEGTEFQLNDRIRTRNDFHGVEFGVNHLYQRGRWLWDVTALCALGEVERVVELDGSTRVVVPGFQDNTFDGGFFVGPGDIGRFRDNDFAAIPQIRANASYCLGRNWYLSAGYTFTYLSSAFRPGQFLNTEFDGSRLGADVAAETRRPNFSREDVFLHGGTVGLRYNF